MEFENASEMSLMRDDQGGIHTFVGAFQKDPLTHLPQPPIQDFPLSEAT
jgi:hypothetical protein